MNGWWWLLIAGGFEVGMTTALKLEQQNPQFLWVFIVCAIVSFQCLSAAIKTIPLGLAYAIWTGIGAVGTVIVGAVAFDDPLGPVRVALLGVLVAAMVGLKLVGGKDTTPQPARSTPPAEPAPEA